MTATQLEHARINAEEWHALADMAASTAAEKRQLVARLQRQIEEDDAQNATATERAKAADEQLARVERGEYVAGIPKPMTRKEWLAAIGCTEREAQLRVQMGDLPEATFQAFMAEFFRLGLRGETTRKRAALRKVRRDRQSEAAD